MSYEFLENLDFSDLHKMDKTSIISSYLKLQKQYDDLEEEYALNILQEEI